MCISLFLSRFLFALSVVSFTRAFGVCERFSTLQLECWIFAAGGNCYRHVFNSTLYNNMLGEYLMDDKEKIYNFYFCLSLSLYLNARTTEIYISLPPPRRNTHIREIFFTFHSFAALIWNTFIKNTKSHRIERFLFDGKTWIRIFFAFRSTNYLIGFFLSLFSYFLFSFSLFKCVSNRSTWAANKEFKPRINNLFFWT